MKIRKKHLSRWTALLLSLLLLFSMMVPTGLAAEGDTSTDTGIVGIDDTGDTNGADTDVDSTDPSSYIPTEGEDSTDSSVTPDADESGTDNSGPEDSNYVIAAFADTEITVETTKGTLAEILALLPTELEATLEDGSTVMLPVEWQCVDDYEATEYGSYTFDPILPDGYELADTLTGWDVPYVTVTIINDYSGTSISEVYLLMQDGLVRAGTTTTGHLSVGSSIKYAGWETHSFTFNGVEAYCGDPSQDTPSSGTYTATQVAGAYEYDASTGGYVYNPSLAPFVALNIWYGYGGPGFDASIWPSTWYDGTAMTADRYRVLTHIMLSNAYSMSGLYSYGQCTQAFQNWVMNNVIGYGPTGAVVNDSAPYVIILREGFRLNGTSDSWGTYPIGFVPYEIYTGSGTQMILSYEYTPPANGYLEIQKSSANTAMTNGNKCYSLEGAVYGIYSDSNCTNLVDRLTTNANGYAKSGELTAGSYWVKEISASSGYLVDTTAHAVTVTAEQTTTLKVTEQPANDPVGITLTKIAGDGVLNTSSLAGAQFTVKFYAGQYSSTSQLPATPTRTWVIETQAVGNYYLARLQDSFKISGDAFFKDSNGTVIVPLGTLTIQETKAAEDYTLEGGWLNTNSGASVSSSGGVILLNVTQDGITGGGYIKGGNYYTKTDNSLNPGQAVSKLASKTTGATFNAASGRYDGTKNPGIYDAYEQVVFTLTVSNTGDQTLFNVNLDDDISDFADYVYNNTFGFTTADGNTFLRAGNTLTTTKGNTAKITNVYFNGNTYSITLDRLAVGDSVKLYAACILFSDDGDHYNLQNTVHLTSQYDCTGGNSSTNKLKSTPDTIKNGDNHSWDKDWINLRAHGSVKLVKYGSDGKTPLEGVTFALLDENGKTVKEVTTGADGVALWENLPLRSYSIVETATQPGLTLLKDPINFTLPLQMTEQEAKDSNADTNGILRTGNTFYFFDLTYEVRNTPTLTLPQTGGSNTTAWIAGMAGCAAALAAAAVFVFTTRRRRAE